MPLINAPPISLIQLGILDYLLSMPVLSSMPASNRVIACAVRRQALFERPPRGISDPRLRSDHYQWDIARVLEVPLVTSSGPTQACATSKESSENFTPI